MVRFRDIDGESIFTFASFLIRWARIFSTDPIKNTYTFTGYLSLENFFFAFSFVKNEEKTSKLCVENCSQFITTISFVEKDETEKQCERIRKVEISKCIQSNRFQYARIKAFAKSSQEKR